MGTPIWDEVSSNIRTIQQSAYERGVIETRIKIAKELQSKTKKPPMWLSKFIEELERKA